jgi:hypothetical protein
VPIIVFKKGIINPRNQLLRSLVGRDTAFLSKLSKLLEGTQIYTSPGIGREIKKNLWKPMKKTKSSIIEGNRWDVVKSFLSLSRRVL